jgi:drug/metabolite transporter (DMT)-like permease
MVHGRFQTLHWTHGRAGRIWNPMGASVFPLGLVIAGGVAYHLGQKAAGGGDLFRVLVLAYGIAFAASLALWIFAPGEVRGPARREVVAALVIGVAALTIEAGFFLAYRSGWAVGTTSLLSTLACSSLLAVVGVLAYGESFGVARAAGVIVASLGAYLVLRG